jgi:hypothetical protein
VSAVFVDIAAQPQAVAEAEPNNAVAAAQSLPALPLVVSGRLESFIRSERVDADVFRVSVGAGQTLVALGTPGAATALNLQVLDAAGALLGTASGAVGAAVTASATNTSAAPVTMHVRLAPAGGVTNGPQASYTLSLTQ